MDTTTVILVGVGGQGTILAADLLSHAASAAGYDVKVSEIHGMSQRGGSVSTVLRFGHEVKSMVTDLGCADCIISFETTEALRNLPYLKEDGIVIVNDETIMPIAALTGKTTMPQHVRERLAEVNAWIVPANQLAEQAGTIKVQNVVLLGVISKVLQIDEKTWKDVIAKRVPQKWVKSNLAAFDLGRSYASA